MCGRPAQVLFLGACPEPPCMVTAFCARGSLLDVLARARASPVRPWACTVLALQRVGMRQRLALAMELEPGTGGAKRVLCLRRPCRAPPAGDRK